MAAQNQRLPKHAAAATTTTAAAAAAAAEVVMPVATQVAVTAPTPTPPPTAATATTAVAAKAPAHQGPAAPALPASAANSSTNGGPRVSFNRDVHVKRIGKRSNEPTNYETTNLQPPQQIIGPYHQLPADLSAESIRKEAAFVLAQAERHKSKAENADNIPTFRVKGNKRSAAGAGAGVPAASGDATPKKFHSLPTRKKKSSGKPVARSVSDAAAKKPSKRPSIFSIFSRKSDSNISQAERDPRFEDSGGRRLVRSKSDVGSSSYRLKKALKEAKATQSSPAKQPPTQLSPIIENAQKEEFFAQQTSAERRQSDATADRAKHESALNELLERSRSQAELDGSLVGPSALSDGIKDKILTLQTSASEAMHSSQLPAQKLPLTKGLTVNGLAKRLSMERFSPPPPPIPGTAFSYIRPNEGITYAQLELNGDEAAPHRDRDRDHVRSPVRDYRRDSSPRDGNLSRPDYVTSQRNLRNATTTATTTTTAYSPSNYNNTANGNGTAISARPAVGPTTIRISSSLSPSPWQQLSPRNLSDEDEGLGIETRKYYDDDLPKVRCKSPAEPPIVPIIRSLTPTRENGYPPTAERYLSPGREDAADDLGYRRARLESRIMTRHFGDAGTLERPAEVHAPVQQRLETSYHHHHQRRYLSAERDLAPRDLHEPRFHKPETSEILQKYSPERTHLDIIAPTAIQVAAGRAQQPKTEKTSRYKHTKYYDDGRGGVKEVYERETRLDAEGRPHVRETRHRERLDSYSGRPSRERSPAAARPLAADYEPRSLDSHFVSERAGDHYHSSPENVKRHELGGGERGGGGGGSGSGGGVPQYANTEERWHSSLKRDKLQQRSFDKGDSGIENDFRKESFNGDLSTKWRKRTAADDMKACDTFLRKERRHCAQQLQQQRQAGRHRDQYVYRERSIDDGSHYDPHLDKYPVATSTLRRRDQHSQTGKGGQGQEERSTASSTTTATAQKRSHKKLGGFEKVKQLFTGSDKKEGERHARTNSSTSSSGATQQTITPKDKDKDRDKDRDREREREKERDRERERERERDKYMVKEEEMRSRYREYRANGVSQNNFPNDNGRESKTAAVDISTRRRLSTPKASPLLLKRTSSDKAKTMQSPLAKPEKTSWFKSLDRRSKSKSKEKLDVTVNGQSETASMKRSKNARSTPTPAVPAKNLRFFGDTDLDSNPPTISKAATKPRSRAPLSSTLNRSQKYSHSAHHLDRISGPAAISPAQRQDYRHNLASPPTAVAGGHMRHRSSSMHNLDKENAGNDEVDMRKRRHYSRSRDLDDISESGSEKQEQQKPKAGGRTLSRERLDRAHRHEEHAHRRSSDRHTPNGGDTSSSTQQPRRPPVHHHPAHPTHPAHPVGPPKPARSADRRGMSYSRERDRYPAESSGTEGESSLPSQRSVVYLHATTVGAIPQPYHLRRRSMSRDDLRSAKAKNQPLQPMTRTVSRSVSMLAPWKPKLISEGYEINYSQEQNQRMSTLPRQGQQSGGGSTLTRNSNGKKSDPNASRPHRKHELLKDDQSSLRNSSTTSASKSGLSANLRKKVK